MPKKTSKVKVNTSRKRSAASVASPEVQLAFPDTDGATENDDVITANANSLEKLPLKVLKDAYEAARRYVLLPQCPNTKAELVHLMASRGILAQADIEESKLDSLTASRPGKAKASRMEEPATMSESAALSESASFTTRPKFPLGECTTSGCPEAALLKNGISWNKCASCEGIIMASEPLITMTESQFAIYSGKCTRVVNTAAIALRSTRRKPILSEFGSPRHCSRDNHSHFHVSALCVSH